MMHLVPSCPSPNYFSPAYSPESPPELNFEFDLNLLPSSDCADVVAELDLPLPLSADPFQVSIFLMLKKLFLQPHPPMTESPRFFKFYFHNPELGLLRLYYTQIGTYMRFMNLNLCPNVFRTYFSTRILDTISFTNCGQKFI
jgi:hypothetical protein